MRQLEERHKSLGLLHRSRHHADSHSKGLGIAIGTRKLHIEFHLRLKLFRGFQASREGGIIDITQGRHVVLAYPRPEAILLRQKRWLLIEYLFYRLHTKGRLHIMRLHCHGNILLALAERNEQSLSEHDLPFHPFWDRISKQAWQWQGQYHVYIFHIICKDSNKKADTQYWIPAFIYFNMQSRELSPLHLFRASQSIRTNTPKRFANNCYDFSPWLSTAKPFRM